MELKPKKILLVDDNPRNRSFNHKGRGYHPPRVADGVWNIFGPAKGASLVEPINGSYAKAWFEHGTTNQIQVYLFSGTPTREGFHQYTYIRRCSNSIPRSLQAGCRVRWRLEPVMARCLCAGQSLPVAGLLRPSRFPVVCRQCPKPWSSPWCG